MTFANNITLAKEQLLGCERPLFLFDDDPDGLAAFLILYKMVRAGKGMALKGATLDERFATRVNDYQPDLVVLLDKPDVDESFFRNINVNCIWIDHHDVQRAPDNVLYINPREERVENNLPTSLVAYKIAQEDVWIAAVGIVADWQLPPKEIWDALEQENPGYLPKNITKPDEALYNTPIGKLVSVFSFNLKGRTTDVLTSMKILTRIKNPRELLEKEHSQARLIMKKYEQHLTDYEAIKKEVNVDEKDPVLLFTYDDARNSYTRELSNEYLHLYPNKLIIIARQSNGSYKCSLRSSSLPVEAMLQEVLAISGGTGGGHEQACGAVIPSEQFDVFVDEMRKRAQEKNN